MYQLLLSSLLYLSVTPHTIFEFSNKLHYKINSYYGSRYLGTLYSR